MSSDGRLILTVTLLFAALIAAYIIFIQPSQSALNTLGGLELELEIQPAPNTPEEDLPFVAHMVEDIVEFRIGSAGIENFVIETKGETKLHIEIPCPSSEDCQIVRNIPPVIMRPGKLQFKRVIRQVNPAATTPALDEELYLDLEGNAYLVEMELLLANLDIESASPREDALSQSENYILDLKFTEEGALKLAQYLASESAALEAGDQLAIILDGVIQSAPAISPSIIEAASQGWQAIQNGTTISGRYTDQEAKNLALVLGSGPLPAELHVIEQEFHSPRD